MVSTVPRSFSWRNELVPAKQVLYATLWAIFWVGLGIILSTLI